MPCAHLDARVVVMAARTKHRGLDLDSLICHDVPDCLTTQLSDSNAVLNKMMARLRASTSSPHKYHNMSSARLI